MMKRYVTLFVLLLLSVASPTVARGGGATLEARQYFDAGAAAYAAGDYQAAIQAFDAAYALKPLPEIAFSLAQAERRQYFASHDAAHLDREQFHLLCSFERKIGAHEVDELVRELRLFYRGDRFRGKLLVILFHLLE